MIFFQSTNGNVQCKKKHSGTGNRTRIQSLRGTDACRYTMPDLFFMHLGAGELDERAIRLRVVCTFRYTAASLSGRKSELEMSRSCLPSKHLIVVEKVGRS